MRLTLTSAQLKVLAKLDRGHGISLYGTLGSAIEADVLMDAAGGSVLYGITEKGSYVELPPKEPESN